MYELVLLLHSWLRWGALIAGVAATVMALVNRPQVERWGLIFMITLDLQMLLGLLLYFALSPNTRAILEDFGGAMSDPVARFWAVEHLTLMFAAVVLAHLGRVLARKAATPGSRRMRALICFGLATVAMIAAIPWPGMASGRPLFRM
jgi:hypothetical protein